MRLSKVVPLDENRVVTVYELRLGDVRKYIAKSKNLGDIDIKQLLTDEFEEVFDFFDELIQFKDTSETLDDLSFSEIPKIKDAFMEVNACFLDLIGQMIGLADLLGSKNSPVSESLIEPAQDSSAEDTAA